jgi:hypothetical protein
MQIPDFVIHYSRGTPFQSITSLSGVDSAKIIENLSETETWGISRFRDQNYLPRRLEVEKILREKFLSKGGKPILSNPIYFFLGRNANFERHKCNTGHRIALRDLPPDSISFTYGDSLLAHCEEYRSQSGEKYQNILCREIFLLNELQTLFSDRDFPEQAPLSIEAQLWIEPFRETIEVLA